MTSMRRLVAATIPVAIVAALSWFGVFTFVNAYLVRGLGWTNEQWTQAVLCLTIGMAFWYPVCTELASHIGRRYTVIVCMGSPTLAYGIMLLSQEPWVIYAMMTLMGAATASYLMAWTPLLADAGGDRPGRAMALAAFMLNGISSLCLIVGGRIMATEDYGFALACIAGASLAALVAFIPLSAGLESRPDGQGHAPAKDLNTGFSFRHLTRADIALMLRGPLPLVILFGICSAPFAFQSSNALFPNLSRDVHGMSEDTIATLVGIGRLPTLLSLFVISHLIDHWHPFRCYGAGLLLDGIVILCIAAAAGPGVLAAGYLFFYLAHGIVWGAALPSVSAAVKPKLRDSAFALALVMEIAAIITAGFLHNRLLAWGSTLPQVFAVCGVITLVCGMALLVYSWTSHGQRRDLLPDNAE